MLSVDWEWLKFEELSVNGLYEMLRLRSAVFVVEQNCVFLDIDNFDQDCWHCFGRIDDKLALYLRCIPPEIFGAGFSSLGRIVCEPKYRLSGAGKTLVKKGIEFAKVRWPKAPIKIGAQERLLQFYENLGFIAVSEPYDEDGIQHVDMVYAE